MSGLKCPPAVVKAGPSHLAFWWMCAACSPGGRPLTLSWIRTPPLLASEIFAVPTGCPLASVSATVTGLLAANTLAAVKKPARAKKAAGLVIRCVSTLCMFARLAAPPPRGSRVGAESKRREESYGRTEMAVKFYVTRGAGNRLGATRPAAGHVGGARRFHRVHPTTRREFPRFGCPPAGPGVLAEPGV